MKGKSKSVNLHGLIGGIYHGTGIPGKTGTRPGTFAIDIYHQSKTKKNKPPLKVN